MGFERACALLLGCYGVVEGGMQNPRRGGRRGLLRGVLYEFARQSPPRNTLHLRKINHKVKQNIRVRIRWVRLLFEGAGFAALGRD